LNIAVTFRAWLIVTWHVPVPVHPSPLHPTNTEFSPTVALSVTVLPDKKFFEHVSPQSIPEGPLVTEPSPSPAGVTVSGNPGWNVAVVDLPALIIATHGPVPVHPASAGIPFWPAPGVALHPVKTDVPVGTAVSVATVPCANVSSLFVQVAEQLPTSGFVVTVPVPPPANVTLNFRACSKSALTLLFWSIVTVQGSRPGQLNPGSELDQPPNLVKPLTVAVSVTVEAMKVDEQVVPQLIPGVTSLFTVPPEAFVPVFVTPSCFAVDVNAALTLFAPSIVTTH
jgi:hypothetical protein